jgi:hypothetical protein
MPAALVAIMAVCLTVRAAQTDDKPGKAVSYPRHILIIRHAEKTGDKDDIHLSEKGKKRAEALPALFTASKDRPEPLPTPDFIIAASADKSSNRPIETVTPLAAKLKLTIIDKFSSKLPDADTAKKPNMNDLRDELFSNAKYAGKVVLISWRHKAICELAKTLKAKNVPAKWEDDVFDRVWDITYDEQGVATFRDFPQRLLPGDAAK